MAKPVVHSPLRKTDFPIDLPHRAFRRHKAPTPLSAEQPLEEEMRDRLRRFALFNPLPQAYLTELVGSARIQIFRSGDYLWRQGEQTRRILFIESGLAKTSRRNQDGLNRTYGLYGPGDSMGLYAIWAGMKYPTDAVAMSEGMTAIQLDPLALASLAQKHPSFSGPLMTEIGRFTESFINKIDIVSAGTLPKRLAMLMALLIDRYGLDVTHACARLPINMTLEQIGEIVDARVESVARVMGKWKRAGWLSIDDQGCRFSRLDEMRNLLRGGQSTLDGDRY